MDERQPQLQALREEGLTLKQIGERVGLSQPRVWQILNGYGHRAKGGGEASNGESPAKRSQAVSARARHRCATPGCGRKLTAEHSIYSGHTGLRYCWPGEGCTTWTQAKARKMRVAEEGMKPEEAVADLCPN